MATEDPYRHHLYGPAEELTHWRFGSPPRYDLVNRLYDKTRTKIWPKGSLEETVQNLVKSYEMELSHKTRVEDFKTIDPERFSLVVNGRPPILAADTIKVGSYNALLATTLPGEFDTYKASQETFESSHDIFRTIFPSGFAWEVLEVYSGPPSVAFKWRHWGLMEGGFKGYEPTGEVIELLGMSIAKVDEKLRIIELEIYYDPSHFLGLLSKGAKSPEYLSYKKGIEGCPFFSSKEEGDGTT